LYFPYSKDIFFSIKINVIPQICLGTVQFGLPYGITNRAGQVAEAEVASILTQAAAAGIRLLDTAQAYGDAEQVLGRTLTQGHGFAVISKLPAQAQLKFTANDQSIWEAGFKRSCQRLGLSSLNALLLHSPTDLRKPGGEWLGQWLVSLRERGLVHRLGVSIYAAEDLEGIDPTLLDLVQLPLSLYDQRLLQDGTIERLHRQGCAIHARSVFLQGLMLKPSTAWPSWASAQACEHQKLLEDLAAERSCSLLDLALGFARDQGALEAVVIGLCNKRELGDLISAWGQPSPCGYDEWQTWLLNDDTIIDPRHWPR